MRPCRIGLSPGINRTSQGDELCPLLYLLLGGKVHGEVALPRAETLDLEINMDRDAVVQGGLGADLEAANVKFSATQ